MKYIYLSLFIILVYSGNAQTKLETEKWIISKFNKWQTDYNFTDSFNKYWIHSPTSFEFRGCKLIYKETIFTTKSISYKDINTYELDIGDIVNIYWLKNRLVLISRKKNVAITRSQTKSGFGDGVVISFDLKSEKDLDLRLLKAFNHLKSFCNPSKDEMEPF